MTQSAENDALIHLPCDMGCQPDWHHDDCAVYVKVARDTAENDAPDLVTWTMPREDARDLLVWLRHNRPLGMPDSTFNGLIDALLAPRVIPPELGQS